jgi:hypothetical protein
MPPRTQAWKHKRVGWKDCLLDDDKAKFMHVHWFPAWTGKLFFQLWNRHLVQRALMRCDHPFAFVSQSGEPYTLRAYNFAHARAVRRIDLVPAKDNGTTPHGHRHAYGQRITDAGIDPLYRKKALHSQRGVKYNNVVHEFLAWVLTEKLSVEDDHGQRVVPSEYHNPALRRDQYGLARAESNKAPLPYRYIRELREILAPGRNFCDWVWAQQAVTGEGTRGGDWFEVDPHLIDASDPNCVWRTRTALVYKRQTHPNSPIDRPVPWTVLQTKHFGAMVPHQAILATRGSS